MENVAFYQKENVQSLCFKKLYKIPWLCTLNTKRSFVIDCFTEILYQNRYYMINDSPLSKAHMPSKAQNYELFISSHDAFDKRNDMQTIYHVCIACTSSQPCACVISNAFTFDIKFVIFVINIISNDLQHMYINFLRVSQEAKKTNLHHNSRKGCCCCFG